MPVSDLAIAFNTALSVSLHDDFNRPPEKKIAKAKQDAPAYREAAPGEDVCSTCLYARGSHCDLYQFHFDRGWTCDSHEESKGSPVPKHVKGSKPVMGPPPSPNRPKYPYVGTLNFQGLLIYVENEPGSVRKGTDQNGDQWAVKMRCYYGEIPGTMGADGDAVDVYVGSDRSAPMAYVIHQEIYVATEEAVPQTYDEDKVMLGFRSRSAALAEHAAHFDHPVLEPGVTEVKVSMIKDMFAAGELEFGAIVKHCGCSGEDETLKADTVVGRKISILMDEGYPQKQAIAIAMDMERRGELSKARGLPVGTIRTHGGIRKIKRDDGMWVPVKSGPKRRQRKVPPKKKKKGSGSQLGKITYQKLRDLGVKRLPPADIPKSAIKVNLRMRDIDKRAVISWRDSKGKWQHGYTPVFHEANAQAKWARVNAHRKDVPKIIRNYSKKLGEVDHGTLEHQAMVATLVMAHTGLRPGNEKNLDVRGVSTLVGADLAINGNTITFDFIGKGKKRNTRKIVSEVLAKALKRYSSQGKTKRLFDQRVLQHVRKRLPKGMKPKDFRTIKAANTAMRALRAVTQPPRRTGDAAEDAKAEKIAIVKASKIVAEYLDNTPSVARGSYIPPEIIAQWALERD